MQYDYHGSFEQSSNPYHLDQNHVMGDARRRRRDHRAGGSDGHAFGTGRFREENERNERRRRRRRRSTDGYGDERRDERRPEDIWGLGEEPRFGGGLGVGNDGNRTEAEWGRLFLEAFRRAAERRRAQGYASGQGMSFEEFLAAGVPLDDLIAGYGGYGPEGDGREGGGADRGAGGLGIDAMGSNSQNPLSPDGTALNFEELFGSPGYGDRPGAGGGYGVGAHDNGVEVGVARGNRRGGAGMTWGEFMNLFRSRFGRPSQYGYSRGPPPAGLFDHWHTDW